MNSLQLGQLAAPLVAVATPWIVVRIACEIASRHARGVQHSFQSPHTVRQLLYATVPAIGVVGVVAVSLPAPSIWMAAVDGLAFVVLAALALRALGDIERVTVPAREVPAVKRMATLTPRRIGQYVPWSWRLLSVGITVVGVALLAFRVTDAHAGRRFVVPVGFALAAPVFLYLYETWMRQLVTEPFVADMTELEPLRRRWVQVVFFIELTLVTVLLSAAHALLDLDWTIQAGLGTAISLTAALAGIIGCAFAVSSQLVSRRYAPADNGADGKRHAL